MEHQDIMQHHIIILLRVVLGVSSTLIATSFFAKYLQRAFATTLDNWRNQWPTIFSYAYLMVASLLGTWIAFEPLMLYMLLPCLAANLLLAALLTSTVVSSHINVENVQKYYRWRKKQLSGSETDNNNPLQ